MERLYLKLLYGTLHISDTFRWWLFYLSFDSRLKHIGDLFWKKLSDEGLYFSDENRANSKTQNR